MSRKVSLNIFVFAALIMVLAGGAFGAGWVVSRNHDASSLNFASLGPVYNELKNKFDGQIDPSKMLDGAKEGLAAATGDPYTVYLPKDQLQALNDQLSGTLSGIGAEVGLKNNQLVIISPIADSPAQKAGLRAGDAIAKIDGEDPSGLTLDQAVAKIRGKAGTQVKLTIVRSGGQPFDVTITRAVITVPSVKWSMKPGGIGYINITQFGDQSTIDLMNQAATDLKAQGAKKIILDLRNDPGGYLDTAVSIAGHFLSNQLVVEERHNNVSQQKLYTQSGGDMVGLPMVVLINGGSASASEILAGALHDHHAATLIGEKSFGKGSVQEIDKIGDAGLKITIAHWYTPNGVNITKEGIQPDQTVKLEQADYDAGRDPQLDAAITALSK